MNCRYGPVIRKTIPNRKNRSGNAVPISEISKLTVRNVADYGSGTRKSKINRKKCGEGTVPIPENSNSTVRNVVWLRFRYQKYQI